MQQIDTQKNYKAAAVTIVVHAVLLFLFFVLTIAMAVPTPPPVEEGIEVNLGNSDIGFGDVQPLIPDEPAPESIPETTTTPPQQQIAAAVDETEKGQGQSALLLLWPVFLPRTTPHPRWPQLPPSLV